MPSLSHYSWISVKSGTIMAFWTPSLGVTRPQERRKGGELAWQSDRHVVSLLDAARSHRPPPVRALGNPSTVEPRLTKAQQHSVRARSCLTLCHPMDCSPRGSWVQGLLQAWMLEWVAILFSRGSSQLRDQTWHLLHCRQILYHLSQKPF